ncbi:MAG: hypothetical protein D6731_16690, partial [Planctomycetota bacterium]
MKHSLRALGSGLLSVVLCACSAPAHWRETVRDMIEDGRYEEAMALSKEHSHSSDERERHAALSLLFGARLAQLERIRDLRKLEKLVTTGSLLDEVDEAMTQPETEDRSREEIVRRHGFDQPLDTAGPELRRKLEARVPSLRLRRAELSAVFEELFEATQTNIVADPAVIASKTITLTARDIPVVDVLEHVAAVHDLHYELRENSVLVRGPGRPVFLTRTYRLRRGLSEFDQSSTFDSLGDLGLLSSTARTTGGVGGVGGAGGTATSGTG